MSHFEWKAAILYSCSDALKRRSILFGLPSASTRKPSCSVLSSSSRLDAHLAIAELYPLNYSILVAKGYFRTRESISSKLALC